METIDRTDEEETRGNVTLPERPAPVAASRIGVLIVNLGTPEDTSYGGMRRYLGEFLSDRRVVETSRLVWLPVLHGIILTTRPRRSGRLYRNIWNTEDDESPLRTITRAQAEKLGGAFADDERLIVDWAMRYGQPSIASRLDALRSKGCDRILIFPLYPQYSATTTATVNDKAFAHLMRQRVMPAIRTVPPYYDDPVYIDALARSLQRHIGRLDFEPEVVLASFHGIPEAYSDAGDPYYHHCQKTVRLLRRQLGWGEEKLRLTFQSRFGPQEWLKPYTASTIEELAKAGVTRIAVVNPGFVADCLETLEEMAGQGAEIFHLHGGQKFSHIPCLNDSAEGLDVLEHVVRRELAGWL